MPVPTRGELESLVLLGTVALNKGNVQAPVKIDEVLMPIDSAAQEGLDFSPLAARVDLFRDLLALQDNNQMVERMTWADLGQPDSVTTPSNGTALGWWRLSSLGALVFEDIGAVTGTVSAESP